MCTLFPWASGPSRGAETSLAWAHICTTTHTHISFVLPDTLLGAARSCPVQACTSSSHTRGLALTWCQHRIIPCIFWKTRRAPFAIAQDFYCCVTINLMAALTLTADATGTKPWATQPLPTGLLNYTVFAFQPSVLAHSTLPLFRVTALQHLRITEHAGFQRLSEREMSPSTKQPSCYHGNLGQRNIL